MKNKVNSLVEEILSSRKNTNKISDLVALITPAKSKEFTLSPVDGAVKVFDKLCKNGEILYEGSVRVGKSKSSVEKYKLWIGEQFTECYQKSLDCLTKISSSKQELVLKKIMELLKIKSRVLYSQQENQSYIGLKFCKPDFLLLINTLLLHNEISLLEAFCFFFEYDDIRYIIIKAIPTFIDNISKSGHNDESALEFIFNMLKEIAAQMPEETGGSLNKSFLYSDETLAKLDKTSMFDINGHRTAFGSAWIEFLKQPLSGTLRKEILINLHSALIPNFAKPSLLADFLTKSFYQGGGLALLSLQGLFILVNDHNLEYPDFYKNLYSLLHPRIFEKRYKGRFFNLLKVFLSSTHIPSYIVAAFVKKMSRLTLSAPPHGILAILNLISSMIKTHPSIACLINGDTSSNISDDPFIETEENLASCNAVKSSLWEIDALVDHYLPEVCKAACLVKKSRVYLCDTEKILESGYEGLIDFDESTFKSNAMNHVAPAGFIGGYEDITAELWDM